VTVGEVSELVVTGGALGVGTLRDEHVPSDADLSTVKISEVRG
jgi:hypothetical protein